MAFFAAGLLTAPEANAKGQWTLVVFIGGILSIAKFMNTTGVSAWLASLLGPIFAPIMSSPYIFVPCLCIITFALRYVIVSQTCMLTMMIAIFGPLMEAHGMSMFILVFVEWLCGTYWNTAYGNPSVVGFIKMTRRQVRRLSLRAEGFLRLHGHNDHRHAGQRPALAGDRSLLIRISPSDPPSPVRHSLARGTLSRCAAGQGA